MAKIRFPKVKLPRLSRRAIKEAAAQKARRTRESLDRIRDETAAGRLRSRIRKLASKVGITKTGQFAIVSAVILWIVARIVAGDTLYVIAYGIIVMVGVSYFLAPRKLPLEAEREGLFPRAQEGDKLEVFIKASAKKRIPPFQLEERVPEQMGTPLRVPIAKVRPGEEVTHSYGLQCTRRGAYEIGPLLAITQDPVGVMQRETLLREPFELLVHPRVSRVSDRPLTRLFEDPPIRPPVSKPWPSGMEFYGMREYRPGDDLRRIVWRASARTGKLMVREAEQGITDQITLILDTDRGSHSRDGDHSESFETGVRACASLGVRHLHEGYEVSVHVNAGPLTRALRGQSKTMQLLDTLARLQMDREPLTKVLQKMVADNQRGTHTILITPKLGPLESGQIKLLVDRGVSMTIVGLIWDEDFAESIGNAAALGAQVAPVQMGQDLATALHHDIGAGNRL